MAFRPPNTGSGGGVEFDGTVQDGDLVQRLGNFLTVVTGIPESLIVSSHVLTSFTNTAGTTEIGGVVNNFNLNWAYNRNGDDPTSQSINQGIGAVANNLRSFSVVGAGLTSDTTYTITAVGDDGTNSVRNSTVQFSNRVYFGIHDAIITTDVEVLSILAPQNQPFSSNRQRTITYDASAGTPPNYLYYCYPVAFGAASSTLFNSLPFNDFTETTIVGFTNASGHSEDYYLYRTNPTYSGADLVWQFL